MILFVPVAFGWMVAAFQRFKQKAFPSLVTLFFEKKMIGIQHKNFYISRVCFTSRPWTPSRFRKHEKWQPYVLQCSYLTEHTPACWCNMQNQIDWTPFECVNGPKMKFGSDWMINKTTQFSLDQFGGCPIRFRSQYGPSFGKPNILTCCISTISVLFL